MRVDIWSDVVCPWCYIGKRRFEKAVEAYGRPVEVVWHSFQLDPSAPVGPREESQAAMLAGKYGMSVPQAQQKLDEMTALAASEGLEYHFERTTGGNTLDAHRLLHAALEQGGPALQDAMKERLLRAYFTEGAQVDDPATLGRLAAEVGVDGLADASAVEADIAQARAYGITSVPFFVIDGKYGVSGAQSAEVLLDVLQRAEPALVQVGGGEVCGPGGCPV